MIPEKKKHFCLWYASQTKVKGHFKILSNCSVLIVQIQLGGTNNIDVNVASKKALAAREIFESCKVSPMLVYMNHFSSLYFEILSIISYECVEFAKSRHPFIPVSFKNDVTSCTLAYYDLVPTLKKPGVLAASLDLFCFYRGRLMSER